MKSQGKNGSSLIKRRVTASTTCLYTSTQPEPSGGGGGEPEFAVQLKCVVTKYIRAGPGREQRLKRICRGANAEASFVGAVPRDVVVDDYEDCLRSVMRWLLREIRPLRDLDLTDDEWEAILPQDVLPQLAHMVRGLDEGSRAAAVVNLVVNRDVRYSTPQVLMSACTGAAPATREGKDDDGCSICLEALHEEAAAAGKGVPVELPGCAHAFHHRCISEWFGKKPTCPMCRGDVTNHLDPELQKDLLVFSHDDDADPHPHPPAVLDSSGNEVAAPPGDP